MTNFGSEKVFGVREGLTLWYFVIQSKQSAELNQPCTENSKAATCCRTPNHDASATELCDSKRFFVEISDRLKASGLLGRR